MHSWSEPIKLGGHSEFTLLTPIKRGFVVDKDEDGQLVQKRTYEERLRGVLLSVRERAERGVPTAIRATPTIHFARWSIIRPEHLLQYTEVRDFDYETERNQHPQMKPVGPVPKSIDSYTELKPRSGPFCWPWHRTPRFKKRNHTFRSWLLFTSNFDGDLKTYLREFSANNYADLDRVWGNCESYPGTQDFERYWLYARRHMIQADAFYSAYPELSVPRIQQLNEFHARFQIFLSETRQSGQWPKDLGQKLDEFLIKNQTYTQRFPTAGGIYRPED